MLVFVGGNQDTHNGFVSPEHSPQRPSADQMPGSTIPHSSRG